MTWEIGLTLASTAFSSYQKYQQQKTTAAFGRAQAEIRRVEAIDQENLERLRGIQQESDRRQQFLEVEEFNRNNTQTTLNGQGSLLALRKSNQRTLQKDVGRMNLQSAESGRKLLLTRTAAETESAEFQRMGKNSWQAASGTLLKGAAKVAGLV